VFDFQRAGTLGGFVLLGQLSGAELNTFRAFILDANNRIVRAEILAVTSDDEAVATALALAAENGLEVWQGSRRIAMIDKDGAITPAGNKRDESPPAP
jgi:hypothetical protein